jgi:structural maintenance of chromosome 3 (chondroitin sulfate proteoglycan 6)
MSTVDVRRLFSYTFITNLPSFHDNPFIPSHLTIYNSAGSSVMAAYVEIVFDNSDGRFSVESDEVILRRTVGHKKDEFFLNRKRIQKAEVLSLLESAGFSKSNPYYIVQQGKVSNLCVMKDADRLNLLKEVAGTTIYEERRTESLKIMQDTANKQDRVSVRYTRSAMVPYYYSYYD